MARFDPTQSLLAGLDEDILRSRLRQLQLDYLDLSSGRKVQSAGYTQGDGGKTVTFTVATLGEMAMVIRQIQQQLGIIPRARRAATPYF